MAARRRTDSAHMCRLVRRTTSSRASLAVEQDLAVSGTVTGVRSIVADEKRSRCGGLSSSLVPSPPHDQAFAAQQLETPLRATPWRPAVRVATGIITSVVTMTTTSWHLQHGLGQLHQAAGLPSPTRAHVEDTGGDPDRAEEEALAVICAAFGPPKRESTATDTGAAEGQLLAKKADDGRAIATARDERRPSARATQSPRPVIAGRRRSDVSTGNLARRARRRPGAGSGTTRGTKGARDEAGINHDQAAVWQDGAATTEDSSSPPCTDPCCREVGP
jgi:hypothetical protein